MKRSQRGFTLIELMIVVAIVGIIAAAAVPSYMQYVSKSKTTSAMVELFALRTKVTLHLQQYNALPTDAAAVEVDNTRVADYWQNPDVTNGVVSVQFANIDSDLNGETISMTPTLSGLHITGWICTSTATSKSKLPEDCRS